MQEAWKEAFQLRQQLELRAQGRISLVKKVGFEEEQVLTKWTLAESQLVLTQAETLLIERLQGIAAVSYNAILHSYNAANPLQTEKKGISLAEIHPSLQDHWVAGLAASLTFGKEQDLKIPRRLYRLMPLKMRMKYESALKRYSKAEHLLNNVLPHVPLPNGNRGSFRLRQEQWQAVMTSLVELCDPQKLPKNATGILISWVESNKTYHGVLKKEFAEQLLDKKGQFREDKKLPDGRRPVIPLCNKEGRVIVYPKAYPELPGRQLAADCLTYRLTGSAVQASLALFTPLQNGILNEKTAYPVLLSKPAGKTIQQYVRKKDNTLETRKLDSYHFTLKVLATYIIGYEDDKKDNVTLMKTLDAMGNPCWQLVSIDSDHAFFPPMADTTVGSKVQVKTVAYAFPAMNQPLDPEAIADFLSLNKYLVLQEWLGECRTLISGFVGNLTLTPQRYGLFKPEILERCAPINSWFASNKFSFIPIAFEPGTLADIYQRWLRVEQVLKHSIPLTQFDLLSEVSPRLAQAYQKVFNEYGTVAQRFDRLAELHTDYKITKDEQQISHNSSHAVNVSKTLVGVKKFQDALIQGKIFDAGSQHGLKELDEVQTHYQQLTELKKVFQVGLDVDDKEQQVVIQTLELLLAKPYYSTLIERVLAGMRFQYTEANTENFTIFQDKLLNLLAGRAFQELTFVGWRELTEDKLLKLIDKSVDLQSLTIINCPNFSCSASTWTKLSVKCPKLKQVRLSGLQLNAPEKFDELQSLYLENCLGLAGYQINAPKLQKLTLKNCLKLTQLDLRGQPIHILRLHQCPLLSDGGILHDAQGQHLRAIFIRACKDLKFTEAYQKWPFLLGQLGSYYDDTTMSEFLKMIQELKLKSHEISIAARFIAEECDHTSVQTQISKIYKTLLQGIKNGRLRLRCAEALAVLYPSLPQEQQGQALQALMTGMPSFWRIGGKDCATAFSELFPSMPHNKLVEVLRALLKGMKDNGEFFEYVRALCIKTLGTLFPSLPQDKQEQALQALMPQPQHETEKIANARITALRKLYPSLPQDKQEQALQALMTQPRYEREEIVVVRITALEAILPSLTQEKQFVVAMCALSDRDECVFVKALGKLYPSLSQGKQRETLQLLLHRLKVFFDGPNAIRSMINNHSKSFPP